MGETSTNLNLPYLQAAQAQKHVTHNEALERLDLTVQLVLQALDATVPPAAPEEGQVWALGAGASGAWVGQDDTLAAWSNGGWLFVTPRTGWCASHDGATWIWSGSAWLRPSLPSLQNLPLVGINTSADTTNRLAVAAEATLLTHLGAGHQLKLNKAAAGDTASLLYQTGWSGRAEMGTAGGDDFAIKVSADGASWQVALSAAAASGIVSLPQGAALGGALTGAAAQRLALLASAGGSANAITLGYGLDSLTAGLCVSFLAGATNTGPATLDLDGLGAVACVSVTGAALPAGYIRTDAFTQARYDGTHWVLDRAPERGSNANGSWVRSADGTQRCTFGATLSHASAARLAADWTFPAAFAAAPAVALIADLGASSLSPGEDEILGPCLGALSASAAGLRCLRMSGGADFAAGDTLAVQASAQGYWY